MKTKSKVGFSIDTPVRKEFYEYCEIKAINKSKLVNKLIKDFLDSSKK
jgi:hypothetical protein